MHRDRSMKGVSLVTKTKLFSIEFHKSMFLVSHFQSTINSTWNNPFGIMNTNSVCRSRAQMFNHKHTFFLIKLDKHSTPTLSDTTYAVV